MTTGPDEPGKNLDAYLEEFGDRLRAATAAPVADAPQRVLRRRGLTVTAAGALLAGVMVVAGVLLGSGPAGDRLDIVSAARAALAPPGEIVHMLITTFFRDSRGTRSTSTEQWSAADPPRWRLIEVIPPAGSPNSTVGVFDAHGPIVGREEVSYNDDTAKLLTIATTPQTKVTVHTATELRERERRARQGCVLFTNGHGERCPLSMPRHARIARGDR